MAELWRIASTPRTRNARVQLAALAGRQWGVLARWQLEQAGASPAVVSRWLQEGRIHRLHPGVYAAGHRALAAEGRLVAALLYAGPGAMLSHASAGSWYELLAEAPAEIHASTPRRASSSDGVVVHGRRRLERTQHRGLPITSVAQTLLDLAAAGPTEQLRRALAEADYRRLVDLEAVARISRRGARGSAALRAALGRHRPELAMARSVLEERFLSLCERHGIPLPQVNARICGMTVDALWRDQGVIVELDGHAGHATPARVERDRRRELRLRAGGFSVLRYTWQEVTCEDRLVATDLLEALDRGLPS